MISSHKIEGISGMYNSMDKAERQYRRLNELDTKYNKQNLIYTKI